MKHKLIFYSDASHGWLKAPRALLASLGLLEHISVYSYQSKTGATVYLEEDCDAPKLVRRLEELGVDHEISDVDHGSRSHIRSLKGFSK